MSRVTNIELEHSRSKLNVVITANHAPQYRMEARTYRRGNSGLGEDGEYKCVFN